MEWHDNMLAEAKKIKVSDSETLDIWLNRIPYLMEDIADSVYSARQALEFEIGEMEKDKSQGIVNALNHSAYGNTEEWDILHNFLEDKLEELFHDNPRGL